MKSIRCSAGWRKAKIRWFYEEETNQEVNKAGHSAAVTVPRENAEAGSFLEQKEV